MPIFIALSAWVGLSALAPRDSVFKNRYTSRFMTFIILGLILAYIPFLNVYVSDMVRYVEAFQQMNSYTLPQIFRIYEWESLFLVSQWFISRFTENPVVYVIFTFLLFAFILLRISKRLFLPWQRMFFVFAYVAFPFFHMYVFDGIRQGLGMMLLILAMTYWFEKKNSAKFYLAIVAAGLFHDTAFLMGLIMVVTFLFNFKFRSLLFFWSITAFLFVTGLNARILNFGFIRNLDYIEAYTGAELMGSFGGETNKLNFLVFTTFFLIVALFLFNYISLEEEQRRIYSLILKCYIAFSSIFLLFGFIAYSNRIATYAWFVIPLMIFYPILYKKKHSPLFLFLIVLISFASSFIFSPFIAYK